MKQEQGSGVWRARLAKENREPVDIDIAVPRAHRVIGPLCSIEVDCTKVPAARIQGPIDAGMWI